MDPKQLLVYVLVYRPRDFFSFVESLERTTPHQYKVLNDPRALYRRLRLGSLRPRLVIIDDGHPHSTNWVGADIYRGFPEVTGMRPTRAIILTTNQRPPREGYASYLDELRRLGLKDIFTLPISDRTSLIAALNRATR